MSPKRRAPRRRYRAATIRDRLTEAEATLDAIRTGQVDALVVSGPEGERTLTIEGATHPYFTLLNAMSDGAALLEPSGSILFGNRSFGSIAGAAVETLRGSRFQRLVAPADLGNFERLLVEGSTQKASRELALVTGHGSTTSVAISLSTLPIGIYARAGNDGSSALGVSIVLMAIITDLTDRNVAASTRARLLARLMSAEDDERRRIARELHDETGQSLTALLVGLRAVANMSVRPEVRRVVMRLRDVVAHTVDDVGRLARGLHPAVLDDMGLAPAARRYVVDYAKSLGTAVEFTAGELDTPRLPPLAAATMYRILQETLTNVTRHAAAAAVVVEMARDASGIAITVRDDGVGFDVSRSINATAGLGLRGMRERVTLLGGSIEIESAPGSGTTVRARIPLAETARPTSRRPRKTTKVAT